MASEELLYEVRGCDPSTQVVHELFDFKVRACTDKLEVTAIEIVRINIDLCLALWNLDFQRLTFPIEYEPIAFGH